MAIVLSQAFLLFTPCGRLSSKLCNTRLLVLISTILNIMDAVRTVKICIFNRCVSFMGGMYQYIDGFLVICTVSEVL